MKKLIIAAIGIAALVGAPLIAKASDFKNNVSVGFNKIKDAGLTSWQTGWLQLELIFTNAAQSNLTLSNLRIEIGTLSGNNFTSVASTPPRNISVSAGRQSSYTPKIPINIASVGALLNNSGAIRASYSVMGSNQQQVISFSLAPYANMIREKIINAKQRQEQVNGIG